MPREVSTEVTLLLPFSEEFPSARQILVRHSACGEPLFRQCGTDIIVSRCVMRFAVLPSGGHDPASRFKHGAEKRTNFLDVCPKRKRPTIRRVMAVVVAVVWCKKKKRKATTAGVGYS